MSERHGDAVFFLLSENDFRGIRDAFIHDMHIGAYAGLHPLTRSVTVCHLSVSQVWCKVYFNKHKDAFSHVYRQNVL